MSSMDERNAATLRVIEELKRLYKTKIQPLEKLYLYDTFNTACITDAEFDSKPQVRNFALSAWRACWNKGGAGKYDSSVHFLC